MGNNREYLYDVEVAKFFRVSVKTILNRVKTNGNYDGIMPQVIGGGDKRKYRLWKIDDIERVTGIPRERIVSAAVE